MDDEEFDLDLDTGRFIQKKKTEKPADDNDDVDESRRRPQVAKKSAPIPLLEDDDDVKDDLEIIDDQDKDQDYQPDNDDDDDDDDNVDMPQDEDDDDFEIPPLRARKPIKDEQVKVARKKHQTSSTKQRVGELKPGVEDINDETLNLFQKIVGSEFEVKASWEFEQEEQKSDKSINPVEAAGFRATMKTLAIELRKAVRKGTNIKKTYTDMIRSTIEIAKAMKYPRAGTVEVKDILPSIADLQCNAWRKFLQGITMMNPEDVVMDTEPLENIDDLVIQGPALTDESVKMATEAIENLPRMLRADVKLQFRNLFMNIEMAHRHVANASKDLRELYEKLPFNVFLRVADCMVRPLVILQIPQTDAIVKKLKDAAIANIQRVKAGSSSVEEVMIKKNLPSRGKWTSEDEFKARKMIAGLIHKYVCDIMFKQQTATHQIVKEFELTQTTLHRQIWGKRYPGEGQTLDKMQKLEGTVVSGASSKVDRIAAVIVKKLPTADTKRKRKPEQAEQDKDEDEVEEESKKVKQGKGSGKKSTKKRTAAEIRGESTAEGEKTKRKRKKQEEEDELDEDPDMPSQKEIAVALAVSKPASKGIKIIH